MLSVGEYSLGAMVISPEKVILAVCFTNKPLQNIGLHGNLLNAENWLTIAYHSVEKIYLYFKFLVEVVVS